MALPPGAEPGALAAALDAVPPGERVALIDRRFTGHRHALRLALIDPRFSAVRIPGVLTVEGEDRAALRALLAAPEAAAAAAEPVEVDALAERLTAEGGVQPVRPELGELVAAVPQSAAERDAAETAIAAVDEEQFRLRRAVKSRDGFFTTYLVSPYSRYIARWCARRGLTPNQVTTASLLVALIAAGCAATGTRIGFVAAGVLLLASFVLDCTDGQLARYSLQYSTLGAWLDATFDRAKEYAYYAGLAVGAINADDDRVWLLALGAMVLQTVRHIVDFSYNEAYHDAQSNASPTAALSSRLDSVGWTVWARRIVVLPIGERWALIAVLTAATTPRITFVVLLVGCALAGCYTTAGRVLRSFTRRKQMRSERAGEALCELSDSGPLALWVARVAGGRGGSASVTRAVPPPASGRGDPQRPEEAVQSDGGAQPGGSDVVTRAVPRAPDVVDGDAQAAGSAVVTRAVPRAPGGAARLTGFAAPAIALVGTAVQVAAVLAGGAGEWWSIGAAAVYVLAAGLAVSGSLRGPLDWLVPPLFRVGEYLTVFGSAAFASRTVLGPVAADSAAERLLPAAFGLVAAVAYHHYDTVYRIRGGAGSPSRRLRLAIGGHDGRVLLLTAGTAAVCQSLGRDSTAVLLGGFTGLAVLIALAAGVESVRFWISDEAPAVHDESEESGENT